MIKAVLFDMDGVLYDSMPFHVRAWSETAALYKLEYTPLDFYLFEGMTGDATVNNLYQRTFGRDATEEEKEGMYKEKADLFNRYHQEVLMPGAAEVLQKAKASGLQILVVTGSGQYSLFEKLQQHYPGFFSRDKMVTAYDVTNGKPHPEPYLKGLQKAGVQPHEAIVVENAPMGVKAAVAAGIFTIAVNTGPLPDNVLWEAGAKLLYPDMSSLANHWEEILT